MVEPPGSTRAEHKIKAKAQVHYVFVGGELTRSNLDLHRVLTDSMRERLLSHPRRFDVGSWGTCLHWTHTYIYTFILTNLHTYTHTHAHTYYIYIHYIYINIHTDTYIQPACPPPYLPTNTTLQTAGQTSLPACLPACLICLPACLPPCLPACLACPPALLCPLPSALSALSASLPSLPSLRLCPLSSLPGAGSRGQGAKGGARHANDGREPSRTLGWSVSADGAERPKRAKEGGQRGCSGAERGRAGAREGAEPEMPAFVPLPALLTFVLTFFLSLLFYLHTYTLRHA